MPDKTPESPSGLELRGSPLTSARLSRKAALVAIAVLAAVLVIIMANLTKEPPKKAEEQPVQQNELQPALNPGSAFPESIADTVSLAEPPAPPVLPTSPPQASGAPPAQTRNPAEDARLAETTIQNFSGRDTTPLANGAGGSESAVSLDRTPGKAARAADPDLNRQDQKLEFLGEARTSAALKSAIRPAASRFELKTGTVIPSILITELNSDLPGEIVGQVAQNVYDTASGNYLLIPQGTKLFGRYDSKVAFGQGRLLVNWYRLIFPDASTLELGGMAGYDEEGKSGFHDRVNNHYGRLFGFGLLTSLIAAGHALTQDESNNVLTAASDRQVVSAAVGQQMAELGVEIARRNLQVQPRIEIRKGYRLNVMVNRDVVFPGAYQR